MANDALFPLPPPQDEFVAMEHPMEHTLDTAWRMIYERKMPVWILVHAFPDHDKVRALGEAAVMRGERERDWMNGGVGEYGEKWGIESSDMENGYLYLLIESIFRSIHLSLICPHER